MGEHVITMRRARHADEELWAQRIGTRAEALASARALLADLREANRGAAVWIDGRRVNGKGASR